jgi:hypothetical protein
MTKFFRREAKFMLLWCLAVPALLAVIAVMAGFILASRR